MTSCIVVQTSPMQARITSSGVSAVSTGWSFASASLSSGVLRWLRISSQAQRAVSAATAIHPPQSSRAVVARAMRNPPSAVMNHPEMTAITPVMRYTALSRPHERSASDEPMATMKTT